MMELIRTGGWVMYPLILFSILIGAICMEKIWYLRRFSFDLNQLFYKSSDLLKEKKILEAKGLTHTAHPQIKEAYSLIFDHQGLGKDEWNQKFQRKLYASGEYLRKQLWILGTIGSSAPFIGLFGTVVGIIKSFESMSISGKGGFAIVSKGLSEALVATAAGILVAVIALLLYNMFQVRIKGLTFDLRNKLEDLKDLHQS
jgi:biopolymer transport protein ExbB/TolQ